MSVVSFEQGTLFNDFCEKENSSTTEIDQPSPALVWEQNVAKHALDELFTFTQQYKSSQSFHELIKFAARFRFYSPFNAMLVHIQQPGAMFVAPPYRWLRDYKRQIKPGAKPLVILQPMGPVMFVFDVADTEPTKNAPPLPKEVEKPFALSGRKVGRELDFIIENAKRDGIRISRTHEGSQSAGSVRPAANDLKASLFFQSALDKERRPVFEAIPIRYDLIINEALEPNAQYVTTVHELAHLYCGHLGTPNAKWWPDRRGLSKEVREFEAESVAHLVALRAGIDSASEKYLSGYLPENKEIPPISLECVMKSAGLIEAMSSQRMKPRKQKETTQQ